MKKNKKQCEIDVTCSLVFVPYTTKLVIEQTRSLLKPQNSTLSIFIENSNTQQQYTLKLNVISLQLFLQINRRGNDNSIFYQNVHELTEVVHISFNSMNKILPNIYIFSINISNNNMPLYLFGSRINPMMKISM